MNKIDGPREKLRYWSEHGGTLDETVVLRLEDMDRRHELSPHDAALLRTYLRSHSHAPPPPSSSVLTISASAELTSPHGVAVLHMDPPATTDTLVAAMTGGQVGITLLSGEVKAHAPTADLPFTLGVRPGHADLTGTVRITGALGANVKVGLPSSALFVLRASAVPMPPPPPPLPVPPPPVPSGLPWLSGAGDAAPVGGDDYSGMTSWARRHGVKALGVWTSFMVHDTKAGTLARVAAKVPHLTALRDAGTRLCQTVPIITAEDVPNAEAFIGSPEHVAYLKEFFQALEHAGHDDAFCRLGHEMNGEGYPWGKITADQFKLAFKVAAGVMRDVLGPKAQAVFNPLRGGEVAGYWPGDDEVDLVGVDWYNNGGSPCPGGYIHDQATWDAAYLVGSIDQPRGWGQWLAFAEKHGKKLCVPEWGCGHGSSQSPSAAEDVPGYVPVLKRFFTWAGIVFETYYNNADHSLDPVGPNLTKFAERYFAEWMR